MMTTHKTMATLSRLLGCVILWIGVGIMFGSPGALADNYAAQNGQTPGTPYTSWGTAASNIQDAVNAAYTNVTVWVGAGRYTVPTNAGVYLGSNVVYINRPLTLRSSNGVPETTIIDGSGTNRGIAIVYANTTNRFIVDGFTISNCYATNAGGGVLVYQGLSAWTSEVRNCVISDNIVAWGTNVGSVGYMPAGSYGGGIANYRRFGTACDLIISNCVIRGNRALTNGSPAGGTTSSGGGIYCFSDVGQNRIMGSRIESNSAVYGGGVCASSGSNIVENCVIRGNYVSPAASSRGAGFMLSGGAHIFRNCLIYNNVAERVGGGFCVQGKTEMYNCTIVSNAALLTTTAGSGVSVEINNVLQMNNSIVYSNAYANDIRIEAGSTVVCTNSCTSSTNSVLGSGNITNNPAFVDDAGQNYRLPANSPCVNKGLNQNWMTNALDLDGKMRIRYGTVDMGAFETLYRGTIYGVR